MTDVVRRDPVADLLQGRAELVHDFEMMYGLARHHTAVRVRVFKKDGVTLVALSAPQAENARRALSRFVDLLIPQIVARLNLDRVNTFWLEHVGRTNAKPTLALVEVEWPIPESCRVKWKTFQAGEYHYYAGSDHVADLARVLDQRGLRRLE